MSSAPLDYDRAIERWDKQKANFIKTLDLSLVEVGRGTAAMRMPFRPAIANNAGAIHGGAIVSLCDTVFWVALASLYGPEQPTATASLSCNFLRPALPPNDLIARATVLKPGARIVYGEVHVFSGEKLVAHATLSFLNTPASKDRALGPGRDGAAISKLDGNGAGSPPAGRDPVPSSSPRDTT